MLARFSKHPFQISRGWRSTPEEGKLTHQIARRRDSQTIMLPAAAQGGSVDSVFVSYFTNCCFESFLFLNNPLPTLLLMTPIKADKVTKLDLVQSFCLLWLSSGEEGVYCLFTGSLPVNMFLSPLTVVFSMLCLSGNSHW